MWLLIIAIAMRSIPYRVQRFVWYANFGSLSMDGVLGGGVEQEGWNGAGHRLSGDCASAIWGFRLAHFHKWNEAEILPAYCAVTSICMEISSISQPTSVKVPGWSHAPRPIYPYSTYVKHVPCCCSSSSSFLTPFLPSSALTRQTYENINFN